MRIPAFLVIVLLASLARAEVTLEGSAQSVPRYARIEFTLGNVPAVDPHGDAAANIGVDIVTPSGKRIFVPAFWDQPFEHRPAARGQEWLYPTGEGNWRVRFAPTEVGRHTATPRGGSTTVDFETTASPARGFVRVAKKDPRYFELDDGTPYFAVGQNIAFVKDSGRSIEMIQKFGAAGGNWARVWVCAEDWALAIEARRSAFARSWGWNVPIVALPDRDGYHGDQRCLKLAGEAGAKIDVNPTRGIPLKPSTKYRFTGAIRGDAGISFDLLGARSIAPKARGWESFVVEFTSGAEQRFAPPFAMRLASKGTAFLRDLSLKEAGGSIELLPELDVNRPALGSYNEADAFLVDRLVESAEKADVRLQLTLLTRDHYMHLLNKPGSADYARATAAARNLVRYAAARWGYSTQVFAWEYFNELDPGKPTDAFYAALAEELDRVDANRHLRTSSTWHSPSKEFASARLDVASLHHYLRPPDGELFKDAPAAVRKKYEQSLKIMPQRPLMFAEYGIADPNYQRPRELDQDKELLHLRDGLWATMLGGWAGTASWWYWDDMHKLDAYAVYSPVARFAAGIPWNSGKLTPATASADQGLRVIGLSTGDAAWLWLSDPRATWHSVAVDGKQPEAINGATVKIEKLTPGEYRVEWIETKTGKVLKEERVRSDGTASLRAPDFARDVAVRVTR